MEYQIKLFKLFIPDDENLNAEPIYYYSFNHFIIDKIEGRKEVLESKKQIIFHGRALNDGSSCGKVIEIGKELINLILSHKKSFNIC